MTTQTAAAPTAGRFLFGPDGAASIADALQGRVTASTRIAGLDAVSAIGRRVVTRELCSALDGLLDLDLGALLAAGWQTHQSLRDAGRRTAAAAGSEEIVELQRHRVTSTHRPSIDVLVDDTRLATVHFELSLVFDVGALIAVVRGGALVTARPARCDLTAALSCEGVELAHTHARVDLPGELDLGQGYRLVA